MITVEEKNLIRELARKLKDISEEPIMAQRKKDWTEHNDLKSTKPLLIVSPEGAWRQVIPADSLKCEDEVAREMEWKLRARIFRAEGFHDDWVTTDKWEVPKVIHDDGWATEDDGTPFRQVAATPEETYYCLGPTPRVWEPGFEFNGNAMPFHTIINGPEDLKKIHAPHIEYDEKETKRRFDIQQDVLGDILNVKLVGEKNFGFHIMEKYTGLRGLQNVMYDFYEEPEMTHEAMDIMVECYQNLVQQYKDLHLFSLNADDCYQSTGGISYTTQLPSPDSDADPNDLKNLWGFAEAQELVQVSPEMTEEFVISRERKLLEPFGLTGYGCCEALDDKMDYALKSPNMRRISVSPWANVEKCARKLSGKRAIYSYKPNPSLFIYNFDEEALGALVEKMLKVTEDCCVEIILKDVQTCENIGNFRRWTDLCRRKIHEVRGIDTNAID